MSAQLTPVEMLVKEIEHMEGRKSSLQATIKALDAKVKDIRSQLDLSEISAKDELAKQEVAKARELAKLDEHVAPLQAKVSLLTSAVASAEKKLKDMQHQHEAWQSTKHADVTRLTSAVDEKERRLAAVLAEITTVKAKVSAL